MATPLHLVWHRAELRTHDHPALVAALTMARGNSSHVVPIVIIDDAIFNRPDLTPRRQAHFLENVRALRESYRALGANLVVRRGVPETELLKLAAEWGDVFSIHFVKTYTSYAKKRDAAVAAVLADKGIEIHAYGGQYTHEPGEVLTNSGGRYGVFGPYRRKWQSLDKPDVLPRPDELPPLPLKIKIGEIPRVESDIPLPDAGEEAALGRLQWFLDNGEKTYEKTRNEPGREDSTSKLSYYFNIGALSPRLAFERANLEKWKQELTWWDFYADVLDRAPESNAAEYRAEWRQFPWREGDEIKDDLARWQKGETGYPLVDAGMRELNATGFMHNRVRMICASFLTKHLLIDWKIGEEIFRGLLLCGDRAQNVGNWQWVAGCGVDPSPYFRVFNPTTQGEKFDKTGEYARRWVPELRDTPEKGFYEPWKLSAPPQNYPAPIIDLDEGRDRYLAKAKAYLAQKKQS